MLFFFFFHFLERSDSHHLGCHFVDIFCVICEYVYVGLDSAFALHVLVLVCSLPCQEVRVGIWFGAGVFIVVPGVSGTDCACAAETSTHSANCAHQCSSWVSLLTRPLLFYDRCQFIAAVLVAALVVDNSGMYTAGFAGVQWLSGAVIVMYLLRFPLFMLTQLATDVHDLFFLIRRLRREMTNMRHQTTSACAILEVTFP